MGSREVVGLKAAVRALLVDALGPGERVFVKQLRVRDAATVLEVLDRTNFQRHKEYAAPVLVHNPRALTSFGRCSVVLIALQDALLPLAASAAAEEIQPADPPLYPSPPPPSPTQLTADAEEEEVENDLHLPPFRTLSPWLASLLDAYADELEQLGPEVGGSFDFYCVPIVRGLRYVVDDLATPRAEVAKRVADVQSHVADLIRNVDLRNDEARW